MFVQRGFDNGDNLRQSLTQATLINNGPTRGGLTLQLNLGQ